MTRYIHVCFRRGSQWGHIHQARLPMGAYPSGEAPNGGISIRRGSLWGHIHQARLPMGAYPSGEAPIGGISIRRGSQWGCIHQARLPMAAYPSGEVPNGGIFIDITIGTHHVLHQRILHHVKTVTQHEHNLYHTNLSQKRR